jgi:magnesium-transporting ATPase (P-type)
MGDSDEYHEISVAVTQDHDGIRETGAKPNAIRTTKYTLLNWLPKSVLEQFRRVANAYFLGISVLMILGSYATFLFISPLDPFSTIATLTVILLITSCKEGYEDLLRRKSDKFENNREVTVVTFEDNGSGGFTLKEEIKKSKQLHAGEIVKLSGKVPAPADLLIILTSLFDDGNKCYVETANIDGETNLKLREGPSGLAQEVGNLLELGEPVPALFQGSIRIEAPNANIHKVVGTLKLDAAAEPVPIDEQNIILRSALFSNTDWAYGIVVYTGQETKIQMNSMHAPSKMSKLEQNLNTAIIMIFCAQVVLVSISVLSVYLLGFNDTGDLPYVFPPGTGRGSILPLWLELWFVFFLLYNNFIPLSLYVTIEIVNVGQSYLISTDEQMYHAGLDVACCVRASNLVQELGMVSNIFTDKTGEQHLQELGEEGRSSQVGALWQ